jgi:hypothetical protein
MKRKDWDSADYVIALPYRVTPAGADCGAAPPA